MRLIDLKLIAILSILLTIPAVSRADVIVSKDTVTGTVIGKNKEPLPGAKVEIVGQPYSTFTDLDGRFNIKCDPGAKKVHVSYPKTRDVKKRITPDMTVRIGRSWRQVPEQYQWFTGIGIGVAGTNAYFDKYDYNSGNPILSYDNIFLAPNLSFQVGRVKAVGWYAKYSVALPVNGWYKDNSYPDDDSVLVDSRDRAHSMAAILGGMVRLGCPLHLKLGAGFGYTYLHGIPRKLYPHTSWQIDLGLMFRIRDNYGIDLSMNAGCTKQADISYMSAWNFGFVYFFNK